MSTVSNKKRKIDEIIISAKIENLNDGPATKKMKQAQENNRDESVMVMDEVIIKKEIKIEPNAHVSETDNAQENNNDDVIICSVIENKNNDLNKSIDLAQADDMNCFVKFCPNCKAQANRTQKDIDQRCSIMTCTNCSEWTYWCWDCNTVVDMERQEMRCLNCRKISRKKRNNKNNNHNIKKEQKESNESDESDESEESTQDDSNNNEKKKLLIEITEKDLSQSEQLKTEALNNFIANDMTNAENKYLNALKYNPNDHVIYLQLSQIYFRTSSYYKALISAFKALTFDPSNKQGWIIYGKTWMKLKNFKFARIAFDTAATLENHNNDNIDNKENDNDIVYDEEYIACKSELDVFVNEFKNMYMNSTDGKIQQIIDSILDNDENLRNLYLKHKRIGKELSEKLYQFSQVKQFVTGECIFELVMESKYKSLEYINGLRQISNCWNLTVEPKGIYRALDTNISNSVNSDPMKIETDTNLFDFEKMVFQIQLCNSTRGTVVWCNKGHHGYNPSEWSDMNAHIIFGPPTAMQVVDMIKRTILYHRNGFKGKCELARPSNIVLTPLLTDESAVIKSELEKMNIGCYVPPECPISMHIGPFDGHVMLC